jgi:hypothetical protein
MVETTEVSGQESLRQGNKTQKAGGYQSSVISVVECPYPFQTIPTTSQFLSVPSLN